MGLNGQLGRFGLRFWDALDLETMTPQLAFCFCHYGHNQELHELFPTIPANNHIDRASFHSLFVKCVFDNYLDNGCALQRDILIQALLYIPEDHIRFKCQPLWPVTTLVIPSAEEDQVIEMKVTASVLPNTICVAKNSTKHTFASCLARDTPYDAIYDVSQHSRKEDEETRLTSRYVGCRLYVGAQLAGLGEARDRSERASIAFVRQLGHITPMWRPRWSSVAPSSISTTSYFQAGHQFHCPGSELIR